jgi:hypothetical protein
MLYLYPKGFLFCFVFLLKQKKKKNKKQKKLLLEGLGAWLKWQSTFLASTRLSPNPSTPPHQRKPQQNKNLIQTLYTCG